MDAGRWGPEAFKLVDESPLADTIKCRTFIGCGWTGSFSCRHVSGELYGDSEV